MTWDHQEQTEIKRGLNTIAMKACAASIKVKAAPKLSFTLRSLDSAVRSVAEQREAVVEESHRDGLCFDVNAMLAREIAESRRKRDELGRRTWHEPSPDFQHSPLHREASREEKASAITESRS